MQAQQTCLEGMSEYRNSASVLSLKLTFTLSGMELLKSLQSGSEAVLPRHMAQARPGPTKDVFLQDLVTPGHPDSTHQLRALSGGPWSALMGRSGSQAKYGCKSRELGLVFSAEMRP